MAKLTIIDNQDVTLYYHEETQIVHHELHKFIKGDTFREALLRGLDLIKNNGAKKWLSDDRQNGALTPADTDWAITVWSPQVIQAGWKYWAIVLPEVVVGQLNMKRFAKDYAQKGVTVELFTDPDAALKWLEEVK